MRLLRQIESDGGGWIKRVGVVLIEHKPGWQRPITVVGLAGPKAEVSPPVYVDYGCRVLSVFNEAQFNHLRIGEHNQAVKKNLIYKVSRNDGNVVNQVELRRRINSRNVVVNGELKRLAELAGLQPEGLTFHVARHSFADYARRQSGDLYAVSKTLGHNSLQVTQ